MHMVMMVGYWDWALISKVAVSTQVMVPCCRQHGSKVRDVLLSDGSCNRYLGAPALETGTRN